jgi:hypothetical protein
MASSNTSGDGSTCKRHLAASATGYTLLIVGLRDGALKSKDSDNR